MSSCATHIFFQQNISICAIFNDQSFDDTFTNDIICLNNWAQKKNGCLEWWLRHVQFTYIKKTCLYDFDPLKQHFYLVKLGFRGLYIILLISAQKHRLLVLIKTASSRQFKQIPTIYVLSRNKKKIRIFLSENFHFFGCKIFNIFE